MAWLSGWSYRKEITVTNENADYQTKVLVGESSGAAGAEVDCGGHVAADFDDLRFTAADGQTLLGYWIESITGTTPNGLAASWVQNNATPDTRLYMYYGGTETAVSDGDATFLFFDDFPGSSLDTTNKWDVSAGDVGVTGSELVLTGTTGTRGVIYAQTAVSVGAEARYKMKSTGTADFLQNVHFALWDSASANSYVGAYGSGNTNKIDTRLKKAGTLEAAKTEITFSDFSDGFIAAWRWTSTSVVWYDITADTARRTATDTTYIPAEDLKVRFQEAATSGIVGNVDWVFVRKYAATEPSFAFGSEETGVVPRHGFVNFQVPGIV